MNSLVLSKATAVRIAPDKGEYQVIIVCMYAWEHMLRVLISGATHEYPQNTDSWEALRKHAYSNILKISPLKNWKFSDKKSDIFLICAQNIDCGYSLQPPLRGGSNEYP